MSKPSFNKKKRTSKAVPHRYPTVLLWGHTQVGKTSLFASAFCGEAGANLASLLPKYDQEKNFENLSRLNELFLTLKSGQKLPATTGDEKPHNFTLDFSDHKRIVFQDIKGGLVSQLAEKEQIREEVRESDVLLCMIQWDSPYLVRELNAIQSILPYFKNKTGLIFTKAEKGLKPDDIRWEANVGWWKNLSWLKGQSALIERFKNRVWPVSCYGYQEDGTPSLSLGEFGQLIPYNIKPHKVLVPILWAIETIHASHN